MNLEHSKSLKAISISTLLVLASLGIVSKNCLETDNKKSNINLLSEKKNEKPTSNKDLIETSKVGGKNNSQFKSIAPGASGAFITTAVHPKDSNLIILISELNGVFRSIDAGISWKNISHSLGERTFKDIKITVSDNVSYAFLSGPSGVSRSDDILGILGDTWTLMNEGMESGCQNASDVCDNRNESPIQVLSLDPNDPKTIFAGIGSNQVGNNVTKFRSSDPWHVYVTYDLGEHWHPVFSLIRDTDSSTSLQKVKDSVGLTVYDIHIDKSHQLFIASDRGLYYTPNAYQYWVKAIPEKIDWYELGNKNVYRSKTLGKTWESCSDSSIECPTKFEPHNGLYLTDNNLICEQFSNSNACLPISHSINLNHPHVRGIYHEGSEGRLIALVNDLGFAGGPQELFERNSNLQPANCTMKNGEYFNCLEKCSSKVFQVDPEQIYYRGGVWESYDWGRTWSILKSQSSDTHLPTHIRCRSEVKISDEKTTVHGFMRVNDKNSNHFLVSTSFVRIASSGLYEFKDNNWSHIYEECVNQFSGKKNNCFEENRGNGLWGKKDVDLNNFIPSAYGMNVLSWDPLKVHYGHIMGIYEINKTHDPHKIEINHMLQERRLGKSSASEWRANANVHCPFAGVHFLNNDLYVGAIDVGVLKSSDGGFYWDTLTEDNKSLYEQIRLDDTNAMVVDELSETIYAHNGAGNVCNGIGCHSIIRSADSGKTWDIIGGLGFGNCNSDSEDDECIGNGLPRAHEIESLELDYSRDSHRRILVGTNGAGLFLYDPLVEKFMSLATISDESCSLIAGRYNSGVRITDIYSSEVLAKLAIVTVEDNSVQSNGKKTMGYPEYRSDIEGVYHIRLSENVVQCQKIESTDTESIACSNQKTCNPMVPQSVSVSALPSKNEYQINVGAKWQLWPIILSGKVKIVKNKILEDPEFRWKIVLDFKPNSRSEASNYWSEYLSKEDARKPWKSEYESKYFYYKTIEDITVHPIDSNIVIAAMAGNPGANHHTTKHVYESNDYGLSWQVSERFESIPIKDFMKIQFSPDAETIYLSGRCTSLYKGPFE